MKRLDKVGIEALLINSLWLHHHLSSVCCDCCVVVSGSTAACVLLVDAASLGVH